MDDEKRRIKKRSREQTDRLTEEIADLDLKGLTQVQIADRVGVSQAAVSQHLQRAREIWRDNVTSSYEERVIRESAHYDMLLRKLEEGLNAGSWKHVEVAIKLAERRSRLIGMDAADRRDEARVQIEAAQLDLMTRAFNAAMDAIGADENQRELATGALLRELEGPDGG